MRIGFRRAVARLAAVAAMLADASVARGADGVSVGDQVFYTRGSWIAWNSPWAAYGNPGLRHGTDYADVWRLQPPTFPSGSALTWSWPYTAANGVYGYMALSYGNYDGGRPQTPIAAKRFADIAALTERFTFTYGCTFRDFNILTELYAFDGPGGTGVAHKKAEIGFLLRASQSGYDYARQGRSLGIFVDPYGRSWAAVVHDPAVPYVTFIATYGAVTDGSVDFRAAVAFLRARGVLTGQEWFTGLALGVEPTSGAGEMSLSTLGVDYR